MIGEIHLTSEVVDRLIRDDLSTDERQALLGHLNSNGSCERCSEAADDPDDDERFKMLLDRVAYLQLQELRCRAEAGDPEAEHQLTDLRFAALMRQLQENKGGRRKFLAGVRGRLLNLGNRLFDREKGCEK